MNALATLTKWRIAFFNAVSAGAGCALASANIDRRAICPVLGTFLLACGGAALNQIQERHLDGRMQRTRHRPLPSGKLSLPAAWGIAAGFVLAGLACLALTGEPVAVLLGVLALVSYNAVYTPLKRVTCYAPMIGAVVGAFPPAIGWVSLRGPAFSPGLLGLMTFFVLWQVPHFWLLLLAGAEDYKRGGFALPTTELSLAQLHRVTFIWILGAATLAVLLPLFGVVQHRVVFVALVSAAGWLGWRAVRGLLIGGQQRQLFASINGFALTMLALIILDRMWLRFL
jgi:protoheme IX farnesyltransferase